MGRHIHNALGSFLQELRRRLRLTQEGLAAALGASSTTVSRWERGRMRPAGMAWTGIMEFVKASCKEHPDLLTRFVDEVLPGFTVALGGFGEVRTHNAALLQLYLKQHSASGDRSLTPELLKYASGIRVGTQKLLDKAQSGDKEAGERLRLTFEFTNTTGHAAFVQAMEALLNQAREHKGKTMGKRRSPGRVAR
ncbi:MAG TPA: helix-turn-helix domain-containing protein [Terriglobia bacterium]|nr:helix-turn-helix domain-containing protein [Terriglobia bacterium]